MGFNCLIPEKVILRRVEEFVKNELVNDSKGVAGRILYNTGRGASLCRRLWDNTSPPSQKGTPHHTQEWFLKKEEKEDMKIRVVLGLGGLSCIASL